MIYTHKAGNSTGLFFLFIFRLFSYYHFAIVSVYKPPKHKERKEVKRMRFYKSKATGQILREDDARKLCKNGILKDHFEALQGDELTRATIDDIIATHAPSDKYKYMLLDRLRGDCGYYLDGGDRNSKYLWGGSVAAHLEAMRTLYNSFPEDARPEWLTMEQIDQYAAEMEREPTAREVNSDPVGTL